MPLHTLTGFSSVLMLTAISVALMMPTNANACSSPLAGVYVSDFVTQIATVPADGVLAFDGVLTGVLPEHADDYIKIRVFDSEGHAVPGGLQVRLLGLDPEADPPQPVMTGIGEGLQSLFIWRPDAVFVVGELYDVQIDVIEPAASLRFEFEAVEPINSEEWSAPVVSIDSLGVTERTGGHTICCEREPDSCGDAPGCWRQSYVYHPRIEASRQFVEPAPRQTFYRIVREDEVVEALWYRSLRETVALSIEYAPDDEGPYCFAVEAERLSDGTTARSAPVCIHASEMAPYEPRTEPVPANPDCTGQPYVDNDRDGQPDEDQSGLDESYGGPGSGDGTGGDGSSSAFDAIGEGCGCASSLGNSPTHGVWWLSWIVIGLALQRRKGAHQGTHET